MTCTINDTNINLIHFISSSDTQKCYMSQPSPPFPITGYFNLTDYCNYYQFVTYFNIHDKKLCQKDLSKTAQIDWIVIDILGMLLYYSRIVMVNKIIKQINCPLSNIV